MNPLFVKTKIQSSERMVSAPSLVSLLSSMKSENVDIPAGIKFIFQIIYSRAKRRRWLAKLIAACCFKKRETNRNFRLPNPLLSIKVFWKWKFYGAFLSRILWSAAWTGQLLEQRHHLSLIPRLLGTSLIWGKCFTECRKANHSFTAKRQNWLSRTWNRGWKWIRRRK